MWPHNGGNHNGWGWGQQQQGFQDHRGYGEPGHWAPQMGGQPHHHGQGYGDWDGYGYWEEGGEFEEEFKEQGGGDEHQGHRRRRRRGRRGGQGRRGQGNRGQGNRGGNAGQAAARPNPQTPAQQGDPSARHEPEERAAEAQPAATTIESLRAQLQAPLEGRREAEEGKRAAEESRQAAEEEVRRLQSQCEGHERSMKELEAENGRILQTNADLWNDVHKASWHAAAANEKAEEFRSSLEAFQNAQVEKDKAFITIGRWNKGLREIRRSERDAALEDLHKLEESFGRLQLEYKETAEKLTSELQAKQLLAVSLQAGDESLEKTQAQLVQAKADRDRGLDMIVELAKGLKAGESSSIEEDWPMLPEAS